MIDAFYESRVSLKSLPASQRKDILILLGKHGHEIMEMVTAYENVAELVIDYSGRIYWIDWTDDIHPYSYTYKNASFPYYSDTLFIHLLNIEPLPDLPKREYKYCNCKMTLDGIVHAEECPNWVDLRKTTPWGIV